MKNISQVVTQAPNHTETPFCYVSSASATISSLYSVYNCVRLAGSQLSLELETKVKRRFTNVGIVSCVL